MVVARERVAMVEAQKAEFDAAKERVSVKKKDVPPTSVSVPAKVTANEVAPTPEVPPAAAAVVDKKGKKKMEIVAVASPAKEALPAKKAAARKEAVALSPAKDSVASCSTALSAQPSKPP